MSYLQAEIDFKAICNAKKWGINEIISPRRAAVIVEKRRIIAQEMRDSGYSYPEIGYAMNRHHTSIMSLIKTKEKK